MTWINSPSGVGSPKSNGVTRQRPIEDLSVQSLNGIPDLLRPLGADFEMVARRAGVPATMFHDAAGRLSFVEAERLLHECEQATDCPHFGMLLGMRAGVEAAGLLGELALHATSVLESLRTIQAHLHLQHRGAALGLHQRNQRETELAYVIYHPEHPGARHVAEGVLAIVMDILRRLCGPRWAPIEVTFARDQPRDTTAYRKCFGAGLRFNAPRFALVFDSGWLGLEIPGADAAEQLRLAKRLTELERSRRSSTSERTRALLTQMLVELPPSADRMAQLLGVSARTLNRRLASEGTSFKALLEDARFSLAGQLLRETRLPAIEIAAALHYTTPSAFSRAFKSWNGGTVARCVRAAAAVGQADDGTL
jgi:AraC-like DNA-binding protein